jgi:DNA polymerase I
MIDSRLDREVESVMPFSIDFLDDGRVLEWEATADGAVATELDKYTPRFYVAVRDPETDLDLTTLQSVYDQHPDIVATEMVARRPGFRRGEDCPRHRRRPH